MPVKRGVGYSLAKARRNDSADVSVLGQSRYVCGYILPRLAAVARDLQVAVVGPGVKQSLLDGRLCQGDDLAECFLSIVSRERLLARQRAHDRELLAVLIF